MDKKLMDVLEQFSDRIEKIECSKDDGIIFWATIKDNTTSAINGNASVICRSFETMITNVLETLPADSGDEFKKRLLDCLFRC